MKDIATMTLADLRALVDTATFSEDALAEILYALESHANDSNPALALLLNVLAEEPAEVAANRTADLRKLGDTLVMLGCKDGSRAICEIAADALAQFAEEDDNDPAQQHMGG